MLRTEQEVQGGGETRLRAELRSREPIGKPLIMAPASHLSPTNTLTC